MVAGCYDHACVAVNAVVLPVLGMPATSLAMAPNEWLGLFKPRSNAPGDASGAIQPRRRFDRQPASLARTTCKAEKRDLCATTSVEAARPARCLHCLLPYGKQWHAPMNSPE